MNYATAPERQYAERLITFVNANPQLNDEELWGGKTTKEFGENVDTLVAVIPFDSVFRYNTADFSSWAKFRAKFFTNEARFVCQLMAACKEENLGMSLLSRELDYSTCFFDYGIDTEEIKYQKWLELFEKKRVLSENGMNLDLPKDFYDFQNIWAETAGKDDADPPKLKVFDDKVPILFMIGYDNKKPDVKENLSGAEAALAHANLAPFNVADIARGRYQTIDYVFAEQKGEIVTPRMFGWQEMIVRDQGVLPEGHKTKGSWHIFLVPQEDLSERDRKSFEEYRKYSQRDAQLGLKKLSELETKISSAST